MSSQGLPAASFPVPPPLGKFAIVDPRTGVLNQMGLEFLTKLWASMQGGGGTVDQITILFGMHGDVTITADGVTTISDNAVTTPKLADQAVTYAKIQEEADGTLLGRSAGSAGSPQEITVGTGLALAAGVLSAAGGVVTTPVAVAALPVAPPAGTRAMVNNATATTFASVVAGGGANIVPVYWTGAAWLIG